MIRTSVDTPLIVAGIIFCVSMFLLIIHLFREAKKLTKPRNK